MQTTTITQKGQLTIPKNLREKFGIETRDKLFIQESTDHIKIFPTQDILDMAGKFKPKTKKPISAARKELEKRYRRF